MSELHRHDQENAMHYQHRVQRAAARQTARIRYPDVYVERRWVTDIDPRTGADIVEVFSEYKPHRKFEAQYLIELRKVRSQRWPRDS